MYVGRKVEKKSLILREATYIQLHYLAEIK